MKLKLEYPKNALQANLTSRHRTAFYYQMEAAWAVGHTPKKSIQKPELASWLLQVKNRISRPVQKAACDCQALCECQTACECG